MLAAAVIAVVGNPAVALHAATPSWNGKYSLVRYAAVKSGTSMAAGQAEPTFSADYVFTTTCSAANCVATATNGPTPKNPTLPQPSHYAWDGTKWVEHFDFQWDCYLGEGWPKCGRLRGRGRSTRLSQTGRCGAPGIPTSTTVRAAAPSKCRWRRFLLDLSRAGRLRHDRGTGR
ncbi:hypothetical protein NIIDMKKI_18110 [Mycobacterium kansasii]|uniref:Secreted protein n=1 Tax=Mycobacterium kansasii TaxID=1768 RepID=A0A7G1IA69_MYCKA|nr:hypothetical protein NIIDMKKI_18110 [Mycobacterium kansasii]